MESEALALKEPKSDQTAPVVISHGAPPRAGVAKSEWGLKCPFFSRTLRWIQTWFRCKAWAKKTENSNTNSA